MVGNVTFDFLPGFQFLKCVQRSALIERWIAMAPDGHMRAVQFIGGLKEDTVLAPRQLLNIASLKNVRHPRLVTVDAVVNDTGRFVVVSDWTGETLRDRVRQLRESDGGQSLRYELINSLGEVAEGLDVLAEKHGMHHLSLDPGCILIRQNEAVVADYGLVELIWSPAGQAMAGVNPRYAAPELFDNQVSATSDQYSLALMYIDLMLGELPQDAHTLSAWRSLRSREPAGISELPPDDRPIIARALDRDPRKRFATARELFKRLSEAAPRDREMELWLPYDRRPMPVITEITLPSESNLVSRDTDNLIHRAVKQAAEAMQIRELEGMGCIVQADGSVWSSINSSRYRPTTMRCLVQTDGSMWHRCAAWLPKGMVYQKLEGLLKHWQASINQNTDDLLVFQISQARGFLQKLMTGYKRDIEVQVRLLPPRIAGSQLTEVSMWIRYIGRDKEKAKRTLKQVGPNLLQELRTYLLAMPEHRDMERFPYEHRLHIAPVFPDGRTGEPVECAGKDISRLGLCFSAPGTPPTTLLHVQSADASVVALAALARVLRVKPVESNQCEVAARFVLPDRLAPSGKRPIAVLDVDEAISDGP